MNIKLNFVLIVFTLISSVTFLVSRVKTYSLPSVLGTNASMAKVYDDGNGTLYFEYSNPLDIYNLLSDWQGKHPGRTIYTAVTVPTGLPKNFAVLFSYIGK